MHYEGLSLLGKRWKLANGLWREGAALAGATGLPPVVAQILAHRGHGEVNLAAAFLSPRLEQLPNPDTLKDMLTAVYRLAHALEHHEKIAVFGDYDVDGTCATALVVRYFRALGVEIVRYIPDRLTEGYGPNAPAMDTLAAQGVKLVLTVDTGIAATEPLAHAQTLGLDVIITDHHPQHGPLPPAVAVVNPNRADDTSELQALCGTGVVFYVLMALNRHLRTHGWFTPTRPEPKLTQWLDLVALATVCDVMPLVGPNRLLVAKGLQVLAAGGNRGLATLLQVAGIKNQPDASTLGFALGPRINAAGRLESALMALDLLLADDDTQALPLARGLDDTNQARRTIEQEAVSQALAMAKGALTSNNPVLVLANPAWHAGVVGLVASRVKERVGHPVIALGGGGEAGVLKGSGRSVEGINLGAAVGACEGLLISGGGHAMAAGLTLQAHNLKAVEEAINAHVWQQLTTRPDYTPNLPLAHYLAPMLTLDAEVIPASLTPQLASTLTQLEPFGNGNPEPLLALTQAHVTYARPVGSSAEHLKLRLTGLNGNGIDAIAFRMADTPLGAALTGKAPATNLVLAGHIRINTFGGQQKPDFQIIDGRTS